MWDKSRHKSEPVSGYKDKARRLDEFFSLAEDDWKICPSYVMLLEVAWGWIAGNDLNCLTMEPAEVRLRP